MKEKWWELYKDKNGNKLLEEPTETPVIGEPWGIVGQLNLGDTFSCEYRDKNISCIMTYTKVDSLGNIEGSIPVVFNIV